MKLLRAGDRRIVVARTPAFTLTVVLTLALAIGANTAVFSALDAVLLRPLPFPEPDRLVHVSQTQEGTEGNAFIAPPRLEDWNRLNVTFEAIAGYYVEDASETFSAWPSAVGLHLRDAAGTAPPEPHRRRRRRCP